MRGSDTRTPCPTCGYSVNNDRPPAANAQSFQALAKALKDRS